MSGVGVQWIGANPVSVHDVLRGFSMDLLSGVCPLRDKSSGAASAGGGSCSSPLSVGLESWRGDGVL